MTNKFIVGEKWQNIGLKYDGHGREFGIKEWDLRKNITRAMMAYPN